MKLICLIFGHRFKVRIHPNDKATGVITDVRFQMFCPRCGETERYR